MHAEILNLHDENPHLRHIRTAADALERGGIVLSPTETGYCLMGDPRLETTHKAFLLMRQAHPNKKPFALLCRDIAQASSCTQISTSVFRIATRAFPGPYTFVLEANRNTPKFAGGPKRKTVGIRISSHPITQALMKEYDNPLLITSVTDAQELSEEHYFDEESRPTEDAWWARAETICAHFQRGIEVALGSNHSVPMHVSTIIDFTQDPVTIIRDGGWDLNFLGLRT
jgi:tRNA threonylcarbamoyl adenosine modification protein (Sua5/YciO/YrdC/YwlC family)